VTKELTEAMFWRQWPLTAQRFSLTPLGLRDEDGWCPICAVCRDLGIKPDLDPDPDADDLRVDFYLYPFSRGGDDLSPWDEDVAEAADRACRPYDAIARRLHAAIPGGGA
jgi:hypothetical protein